MLTADTNPETPAARDERTAAQHGRALILAARLRLIRHEYGVQWQHPRLPLQYDVARHVYRLPNGYTVACAAGWAFREDGLLVAAGSMDDAAAASFVEHAGGEAARLVAAWAMLDHLDARG